MVRAAEALMNTQRKTKKRLITEEPGGGAEKRPRVVEEELGEEDTRDSSVCSVSVFKLSGQQAVRYYGRIPGNITWGVS